VRSLLVAAVISLLSLPVCWGASGNSPKEDVRQTAVRRFRSVVDYRSSGSFPYWEARNRKKGRRRWTPEEIVELLERYPDYYVDMGIRSGSPTGDAHFREMGRIVNEVQAIGLERSTDTSRLMLHFRNDVFEKRITGFRTCTICDRPGRCTDLCTWEGAMKDAPFDLGWVMTIPREEHAWSVREIWGGDPSKDPWSQEGAKLWSAWVDRAAISAVNTPTRVAALYGRVVRTGASPVNRDHAFRVLRVLLDLRNPDYRAWSVKKLIADIQATGIDPGERAVVQYTYKPGWHTYYAGPESTDRCAVENSHMWTGPANPCWGLKPPGGPFARTPYGPGEFEAAVNAMLREMRAGLVAAGFENVLIATVERPSFKDEKWSILEPSVREAPWLLGELSSSCDRKDLSVPARPVHCRPRKSKNTKAPDKKSGAGDAHP
jgi:hypothetical protein